ncbi:MAG TPA: A/G-specific adenine glycosylase, partial [Terriglobales bacterium]|nr:A/G-specific adenine glycosylase [Terriglobales bacterium]
AMWELPGMAEPDGTPVVQLRHSITNHDYIVLVYRMSSPGIRGGKWIGLKKAHTLPLTGLTRKILRAANLWPSG